MDTDLTEVELVAASVDATDLFVFRRIAPHRFAHVGGVGRGNGWAGIVELLPLEEVAARDAVERQTVVRIRSDRAIRVFGPYYAHDAAIVPVDHDLVVVFGHASGRLAAATDETLRQAGAIAGQVIADVSPAKRLADELEVLHALKELMSVDATGLQPTMQHIVEVAAAALSCEIGVLYCGVTDSLATSVRGLEIALDPGEVREAMHHLLGLEGLPRCEQSTDDQPLPAPFTVDRGIRSYYALTVGKRCDALLLLLHTDAVPRGFTLLCQDLGARIADQAAGLLRTASARDALHAEIERASGQARRDPLTGLGNRLAWDEAMSAAAATNRRLGVVVADLDYLKTVNDEHGHHAGDRYLQAGADVLKRCVRAGDLVVRLGGDEFAVLVHDADEGVSIELAARVEQTSRTVEVDGLGRLSMTLGWAVTSDVVSVHDAWRQADGHLYRAKAIRPAVARR